MKILVDTSIWSLALRKNSKIDSKEVMELLELIKEFRVIMMGSIRQELLSGISDKKNYSKLKEKLRAFEDIPMKTEHYEYAAQLFNICRSHGIQGSHTDYLICAVSVLNNYSIFTTDKDFEQYKKYL